ncbi:phosphate regulon sensor histidine kinase PhoR [Ampullimonas aquatilis]|uniref:phosphate regulon sensor histidine kinase PhoR n=1 Tax=Ampullimonas aquatilis TaxID=1341549 RepID=UPI003C752A37
MSFIWLRTTIILCLIFLITAGLWLSHDQLLALIFCGLMLCVLVFFHVFHLNQLFSWAKAADKQKIPVGRGSWSEVFYLISRALRRFGDEAALERSKHERFIQAIQASPNGVLMLDNKDQIEWCNAMSAMHFGINPKSDYMQKIKNLIRQPNFISYLDGEEFSQPLTIRNTGTLQNQVLSLQIFHYGKDEKLLVSRDITQYEQNDAIRRDFVANVSHELRTPLTVLSGFLEIMRDLDLSEEDESRYIELMHEQAGRMQHIVDDLLTLSRLENNYNLIRETTFSLSPLLRMLTRDAIALSKGRHEIVLNQTEAINLLASESEISSAMSNLISNAVRYTPAGGQIKIDWHLDKKGNGIFSVTDTGMGIPREHIPRLTERFYRVDKSRSSETGGTGLGLAIVKHVLMRHQAHLEISSVEGEGSVFSFTLPTSRIFPIKEVVV